MSQMFYPCSDLNNNKQQLKTTLLLAEMVYYNYVVVQFYLWFHFHFLLFQTHHIIHYLTQKQNKIKFKPMIKLNRDIHVYVHLFTHVHLDYNNFYFSLMIPLIITFTSTTILLIGYQLP